MIISQRRWLAALLLALSAILMLSGSAALYSQRQMRLRGALDGLPDPALDARPPILGVNVELTQYNSAELGENLDLIDQAGFVWVRQVFDWSEIEPRRGAFDWPAYDAIVEETAARELRVIAVLWHSPEWAADSPTAPPAEPDDFGAFAGEIAARYGDRIGVYQIWDEPNLASGWGGQPADAVGYTRLLASASNAIHAADPNATVLTAGLAPTIETGPDNLSDVLYLRALYENGAGRYFDGVAGKPYGFDSGPDDRRVDPNLLNFSRFVLLREEMEQHGDADKLLWASHFGWNALPPGWQGEPSAWGLATAETQAAWTSGAYQRALREWPWSGAMILENWQPAGSTTDPRWGFALRSENGALTPAAQAIRRESKLINGVLWPGVYPATVPLAQYSGEWELGELEADIVENGNSTIDVPFGGERFGVIVHRNNYRAYLYVTVDDQPSGILPQDERGTYAVLTSADYAPRVEPILLAENLEPFRRHNAHIEAERGWDQWAIRGFAVGSDVDTTAHDAGIASLILGSAGLLFAAYRLSRPLITLERAQHVRSAIAARLNATLHLLLALAAATAFWIGAALTWGGVVPNMVRRIGDTPSLLITVLTAGIFYYSQWLVVTLIALIVLFILIYARPGIGLALMMFFAPYYLLPRQLFDRMFSLVEVVSLLTLLAWGIHIAAERRAKGWPSLGEVFRRMTPLDRAVALFGGIAVLSLTWAEIKGVAITELRQTILEPCVMYLVLRTMPLRRAERWRIIDVLILTGVIVSIIGFYQLATGHDTITAEAGTVRLRSVFFAPNNAALFLERLLSITAAVVLIGGARIRRWLYGIAGFVMLAAAILTLSKGGLLLGIPAGLGVVIVLWGGRRALAAVAAGAVLELLALIPLSQHPRFNSLMDFSSGESSSFFRIQLAQSTLRMIADHPITGLGLDQFLYQYRGKYILPSAWQQPDLNQPHNVWLNYWVRLGIAGFAAGVWLQITFWRLAWRVQRAARGKDEEVCALAAGLMGSMAAFLAHGLVDEVHFVIELAFVFFMSLGLMHTLAQDIASAEGGLEHGDQHQQPDAAAG